VDYVFEVLKAGDKLRRVGVVIRMTIIHAGWSIRHDLLTSSRRVGGRRGRRPSCQRPTQPCVQCTSEHETIQLNVLPS